MTLLLMAVRRWNLDIFFQCPISWGTFLKLPYLLDQNRLINQSFFWPINCLHLFRIYSLSFRHNVSESDSKNSSLSSMVSYRDSSLNKSVSSIHTHSQLEKILSEDKYELFVMPILISKIPRYFQLRFCGWHFKHTILCLRSRWLLVQGGNSVSHFWEGLIFW